jgi:hypothetical protein
MKCIFCERTMLGGYDAKSNPDGRAREHCVPDWLQQHLGSASEHVEYHHLGSEGDAVVSTDLSEFGDRRDKAPRFRRRMKSDKLPEVCGRCKQRLDESA